MQKINIVKICAKNKTNKEKLQIYFNIVRMYIYEHVAVVTVATSCGHPSSLIISYMRTYHEDGDHFSVFLFNLFHPSPINVVPFIFYLCHEECMTDQ